MQYLPIITTVISEQTSTFDFVYKDVKRQSMHSHTISIYRSKNNQIFDLFTTPLTWYTWRTVWDHSFDGYPQMKWHETPHPTSQLSQSNNHDQLSCNQFGPSTVGNL